MTAKIDDATLAGIVFVGETLGPLFSEDPETGDARGLYDALSGLDAVFAAQEWPFVDAADAEHELKCIQQGIAEGMESVAAEYRRLFVGPTPKAAPPWGSVYTDHDRVLFGKTAIELHDWLSSHEISVAADDNMPDDHIGRMLRLMAWIAQEQPEILPEYLAEHLLTWAPHFLALMEDASEQSMFAGLARLTALSLRGIREALDLEVVEPKFYR